MKMIDFEAHCYIPEFTGKFDKAAIDEANKHLPDDKKITIVDEIIDLAEGRLEKMDKYGISMQILSFSSGISHMGKEEAIETSRLANDHMYEAIKRFPGRFGAFAQLPENDPDAAIYELERCMGEYGFFGWNTFSNYGEAWLDDEFYFPILERASQLGAPVYIHPDFPGDVGFPRLLGLGMSLYGGVGYTFDTAATLLRLMYNGTFDRLPELKVIVGHLGEGIPFILDRLVVKDGEGVAPKHDKNRKNVELNEKSIRYYFDNNVYVTNSGNFSKPAVACTKDVLGIDRMLFGSDYPYENMKIATDFTRDCGLSEEELEKLCYKNAESAFDYFKR